MRANLDPEIANSSIEAPLYEGPLSLDILGQYFGNVEVNPQEKTPIGIYPYGEFDYMYISIQELDEDFTPEKLVSTLLWSSAMLKLPVETYKSPMNLRNFKITPKIKEEILTYMLKKDNKEVSDVIKIISKQPPGNITDEAIDYLVEARRNRGGLTKEEVDKEANRIREQIKPLLLEDKWKNLPPEILSHVLSIDAQKETIELGDLVSDVYPAFDKYREDINEALKLAFLDKEKFVKKYVENDTVRERFNRFVFDLRNKIPHLSYKTATTLGSMVLMLATCSPIVGGPVGGSVSGGNEIPGETIVLETGEGYMLGNTTETVGEWSKPSFSSVVDGTSSQAQEKKEQEGVVEKSRFYMAEIEEEFVESIDIKQWKDYEIELVKNIQPENYLPVVTSYVYEQGGESKLFNTPLFVLPIDRSTGEINTNLPILRYDLKPSLFGPLKVGRVYELKTPDNLKIILGAPQKSSNKNEFDGEFLVLMKISDSQGKEINFTELEESQEKTESFQRSLWSSRGRLELNFSCWESGVQLFDNVKTTEFEKLLQVYDPESLDWYDNLIYFEGSEKVSYPSASQRVPLGEKYPVGEVKNFVEIFNAAYSLSLENEVFSDVPKDIKRALEIGN